MYRYRFPASLLKPVADGYLYITAVFSPAELARLDGVPSAAVAGYFATEDYRVEDFTPNPDFLELMHWTVAHYGAVRLKQQKLTDAVGTYVYVVDLRNTYEGLEDVPAEDIIGRFSVEEDELVYQSNNAHQLLTEEGLVVLPEWAKLGMLEVLKVQAEAEETLAREESSE